MAQEWTDYNLAWNVTEYGGVSTVRIPPSNIWKPDIFMYNRSATVIVFIAENCVGRGRCM